MARNANATVPRCWYTLVRNRPTPGTPIAKSASLCSANSFTCRGVMICSASDFNSSGLSGATSSATRSPLTLMVAGRPTLSSKSEPLRCTICVIACLKLNAGRLLCVASPMRIHPEKDLAELHRLRVLRGDLSNHACDLGFDLVHDLHGLDDADHLPHVHPAAHFDVGLRGGLGRLVERPHHRGLDLEQLRSGRGCRRLGSPRSARGAGRCCSGLCDNDMASRPHSEGVAMPSLRHPHRRPRAEQTAADLDRPHLWGVFQDLHDLRNDVELHTVKIPPPRPYTSSTRSVQPSVSNTGPSADRWTSSSMRTPPLPATYTPGSIVTTAFSGSGSAAVRARRGPLATIVGNGCASLPCRRSAPSRSPAISSSVCPPAARTAASVSRSAAVASSAAARIAATSPGSFRTRSRSTSSPAGFQRHALAAVLDRRSASFTLSACVS